jgi:soluble lytic murein transglycosylase
MMSSMHRNALTLALLAGSAVAIGATLAPQAVRPLKPLAMQTRTAQVAQPAIVPSYQPAPVAPSAQVSAALARWNSLRQSDGHPFSSYASFLTSYRGWPGETSLRKTAERAIDPNSTRPGEVTSYFRVHPALTPVGHARHAFALLAEGSVEPARAAARQAWQGGVLPRQDEDRLLSLFGAAFTPQDHDLRMETLLANRDNQSAARTLPLTSPGKRAIYDARLALLTGAPDASGKLALVGSAASTDAGLLMDRARWLRDANQGSAARALLAQRPTLATRPHDAEAWFEALLVLARGAEADRNYAQAYQIASKVDDAYAPGTRIIDRSTGERDDYTSLTWLAGNIALHRLNRPADAAEMFAKYANGGRSAQVTTKGYYWAGRAAQAAGRSADATRHFEEAAAFPELFYGQLALERLGRPVPAPAAALVQPSAADRAAYDRRDLVQAARLLGQMGAWQDQSLFVRTLAENANNPIERALASDLALRISRPDLGVWVARNARNDGSPFYTRAGWPEARIPAAQSNYWSLANGIIRQESSFDRAAASHAGALGMMQLMRPTAQEQAGKMGLGYDGSRLTRDADYNIQLGSAYFARLMDQWGGSAPLAVASYNAGAGNVRKWVRENGDPRMPGVDVIRWIEEIPFSETRGYVQRVLENAVVYDTMNPMRSRTPEQTRLSYYLGKSGRPG